ncbi:MAG TPA: radical SAM protein [bacterium]
MNNKILLINPWIYDFAAYDFWIKPVGLLSVGNTLEKAGYQTFLIDCMDRFHPLNPYVKTRKYGTGKFIRTAVEKPLILKHIPRKYCRYGMPLESFMKALTDIPPPDVILITSVMTYWYPGIMFAIQIVKQKFSGIPIVLGGIYATLCYDHAVQNSGADYVIKGPGEAAALTLVNSLTGNQVNNEYNAGNFPQPKYHHYQKLVSVPIFTSYGCPYHCSFCASQLLSPKFIQKNPEEVIQEIEYFYFKRHVRHFAFSDDALLVNQEKHLSIILDAVIEKNLKLDFHTPNGIHPQQITRDLAEKMFRSNFKTLRLSYETSDQQRQAELESKISDDGLVNAIDFLASAGYRRKDLDVYVIMGLPGQSYEEVIKSMLFVASLGAKVRLTSFSPIPGTKDWDRAIELYNMPEDMDPLLTNNSIYPLNRADFPYEIFEQIKNLSKVLNYGLDHRINFFNKSEIARLVKQYCKEIKTKIGGR